MRTSISESNSIHHRALPEADVGFLRMTSPLGEFIRRQRELQELSMRQLADLVGISNPYLSQIERGLREPSEKVLDAIAQNLHLSAEALVEHGRPRDDDGEPEVVAAIRADPRLTARQRQALLEVYSAFIARGRASG
jgi:transcriptional regulator with XRE-family HTH domain